MGGWLGLWSLADARPPPSLPAFAARYGDAVLRVEPGRGDAPAGFLIATVGYAVTALPGAAEGDPLTVVLASGERRPAVVVRAEPAGLAILALAAREPGELFPSLPLAPAPAPDPKAWLLGLCASEAGFVPVLGGSRGLDDEGRWRLDLPCGKGAPVLDEAGRVVAITVAPRGVRAAVGAGAERVRRLAAGLPEDPAQAVRAAVRAGAKAPPAPRAAPPAAARGEAAP